MNALELLTAICDGKRAGGLADFEAARDEVASLVVERDALRVVARDFNEALRESGLRCECGENDCRTTRLDDAIACLGGVA